jgi:hypothetical protein
MVISVQAISSVQSRGISERFRDRAAQLRNRAAEMIAEDIVKASPVDTGTYIMSHIATTGEAPSGAATTSRNKIRGRDATQFQNLALGNLKRSVSKDAILNSATIDFFNRAEHAAQVEDGGWPEFGKPPHRVYAQAKAMAPQRILDAAKELGFDVR